MRYVLGQIEVMGRGFDKVLSPGRGHSDGGRKFPTQGDHLELSRLRTTGDGLDVQGGSGNDRIYLGDDCLSLDRDNCNGGPTSGFPCGRCAVWNRRCSNTRLYVVITSIAAINIAASSFLSNNEHITSHSSQQA